jgi:hypothetical protein
MVFLRMGCIDKLVAVYRILIVARIKPGRERAVNEKTAKTGGFSF